MYWSLRNGNLFNVVCMDGYGTPKQLFKPMLFEVILDKKEKCSEPNNYDNL